MSSNQLDFSKKTFFMVTGASKGKMETHYFDS